MAREIVTSNRVFQLEANHLNTEFSKILDQCVDELAIPKGSEEIKLLFKLYLQWNLMKQGTTIGMKIFNMKYYANGQSGLKEPHRIKLAILSACTLVFPYLVARQDKIQSILSVGVLDKLKLPWLNIDNIVTTVRSLSILNFLLFLRNGQLSVTERILGLVQGIREEDYQRAMSINKVQMELLNRELISKTLVEFLTFVVPLINMEYIKNTCLRVTRLISTEKPILTLAESMMKDKQTFKCAICDKQPFNPYSIGCRHLFCYYCLQTRYLLDSTDGYACPSCKYCSTDLFRYTNNDLSWS